MTHLILPRIKPAIIIAVYVFIVIPLSGYALIQIIILDKATLPDGAYYISKELLTDKGVFKKELLLEDGTLNRDLIAEDGTLKASNKNEIEQPPCSNITSCKSAAQSGDLEARYKLGEYYEKGIGINQNYARAAIHFSMACENGYEKACEKLKALQTENQP